LQRNSELPPLCKCITNICIIDFMEANEVYNIVLTSLLEAGQMANGFTA
jgi:hypothetical protein